MCSTLRAFCFYFTECLLFTSAENLSSWKKVTEANHNHKFTGSTDNAVNNSDNDPVYIDAETNLF